RATPLPHVPLIDAAVDLDECVGAGAVEQRTHAPQLVETVPDERLASEPRVHGHEQHEVPIGSDPPEGADRRRRVDHDTSLCPELADGGHRALQMPDDFDVNRHHAGAGGYELLHLGTLIVVHQVDTRQSEWHAH